MEKKTILISGGSRGLGYAFAKSLSENNNVIILSRTKEDLEKASKELNCNFKVCDIRDSENITKVIDEIEKEHNQIDVLVNNTGVWLDKGLENNSYEQIQDLININLTGQIFLTKACMPLLRKANKSLIVNTNSRAGKSVRGDISVYNATKWGLKAFSMAMNDELKNENIVSIDLYPAGIDTTLFDKANSPRDQSRYLDPDVIAQLLKTNIELYFDKDTVIEGIDLRHLS